MLTKQMNHLISPRDSAASEPAAFSSSPCFRPVSSGSELSFYGRLRCIFQSFCRPRANLSDNRVPQPPARPDAAAAPLVSWRGDINMHARHMYAGIFNTRLITQSSSSSSSCPGNLRKERPLWRRRLISTGRAQRWGRDRIQAAELSDAPKQERVGGSEKTLPGAWGTRE